MPRFPVAGACRCCAPATSIPLLAARADTSATPLINLSKKTYSTPRRLWHGIGSEIALGCQRGRRVQSGTSLRRHKQLRAFVTGQLDRPPIHTGWAPDGRERWAPPERPPWPNHEPVGALLLDRCVAMPLLSIRLAQLFLLPTLRPSFLRSDDRSLILSSTLAAAAGLRETVTPEKIPRNASRAARRRCP
jgi:hypothetical protein